MENVNKEITKTVEVENMTLIQELLYSCDEGFVLYPNKSIRTCQENAEWSSNLKLSCLLGDYCSDFSMLELIILIL